MKNLYAVYSVAEECVKELQSIHTDYNSALESTSELSELLEDGGFSSHIFKFQIVRFHSGQNPLQGKVLDLFENPVNV